MILLSNPLADYQNLKTEIDTCMAKVLSSGRYILGPEVAAFEKEFATYCQAAYGIGVASGTAALYLSLMALNIGPGDEVILPSHTATATATAVIEAGALPVYADISRANYNLDPPSVESCLSKKTKAIIAVHLYGHPAPLQELSTLAKKHGVPLIEDAAQAHGALYQGKKVGSLADIACFSFYPTKNLGAFGDGGMITTNNKNLSDRVQLLREYGWKSRYQCEQFGTNSRLDEMQAAVLRIKLKKLDVWNANRILNAKTLLAALKDKPGLRLPNIEENTSPVFHQFVIQTDNRDDFIKFLSKQNIQCGIHYPWPNHLQKGYYQPESIRVPLSNTEKACQKIVSLPIHQHLQDKDLTFIIDTIRSL